MKFCPKCGQQLVDEAVFCVSCGCAQNGKGMNYKHSSGNFGWAVLGFFFPLVGLILYLLWKDEMPKKARAAGIGASISAVLSVLLIIAIFVIYGIVLGVLFGSTSLYY